MERPGGESPLSQAVSRTLDPSQCFGGKQLRITHQGSDPRRLCEPLLRYPSKAGQNVQSTLRGRGPVQQPPPADEGKKLRGRQIPKNQRTHLVKMCGGHVSDAPALVRHGLPDLFQQLFLDLGWCQSLGDRDKIFHSQKSNRVLVVRLKSPVHCQTIRKDVRFAQFFHEILRVRVPYQ